MYNNSGGVTLLQNAPKAWLLWALASPLALWSVLWRDTNRRWNCANVSLNLYIWKATEVRKKQKSRN